MERNGKKDLLVTLAVLLVVVVIVTGVIIAKKDNKSDSAATTTTSSTADSATLNIAQDSTTATTTDTSTTATSEYKDGTYSATSKYSTPENTESITVNVTLKDGIVTDTSATASMISRESKEYATEFVNNYKSLVVGKSIASIKLSRVSGSSLTSQGFNSAIAEIQTKAKS